MPQIIDLRKPIPKKEEPKEPEQESESIKTKTKMSIPIKIEWTAPEFVKYKKNKNWFVWLIIIFSIILIIAIFLLKNLLFSMVLVFAAFIIYIYAKKEPREIKFIVSGKGVQIDNTVYKFDELKSFWIFYNPPEVKEISIRSKKKFVPYIKIPLGDQNPAEIRRLLLKFLPERRHQESVIDDWARKIRF